ncbi:hypothetical protein HWV62_25854 [Athelia sp. TMB]|nr:hypothetical protein HWV62_25854 [Athelia sp. TMB]
MSETDDRAAKAARARAMLKKKQNKKVVGSTPGIASPPASPSLRAQSPALSEAPAPFDEKTDLGDVFSQGGSDSNWLASLPRVDTPPSRIPSRPPSAVPPVPRSSTPAVSSPLSVASPTPTYPTQDSRPSVEQTLSALESERSALADALSRYEAARTDSSEKAKLLQQSQEEAQTLASRVQQLESDAQNANIRISQLMGKENTLSMSIQTQSQHYEQQLAQLRGESQSLRSHMQQLESDAQAAQARIAQLTADGQRATASFQAQIQNQQQTISLLVSEKASLTASLGHMEDLESEMREKEALLESEMQQTELLKATVRRLETETQEATDKYQEQARKHLEDSRAKADEYQRRVQELEEHIQSDDRAEKLEESLKNTQERAEEFEFQLSKLKQAHGALRAEREELDQKLRFQIETEVNLKSKHEQLQIEHATNRDQLAHAQSERDTLHQAHTSLQSELATSQSVLAELQQKLAVAAAELITNARQLQIAHSDLRAANRRADEAEKTQKDLQAEGSNLLRSLDEMRPKIVELTSDKAELSNKIDSLDHALRNRDATIADLENAIEEMRDEHGDASKAREDILMQREKEHASVRTSLTEMQKAYSDLQAELDETQASLRTLEADRITHYQVAAHQSDEIERLTSSLHKQAEEYAAIKHDLAQRKRSDDDDRGYIERAQEEIESLRAELNAADEEIQQLRATASTPAPGHHAKGSLDTEMLSAVKQQHSLDLSTAHSQIRSLETAIFDAQAQSHTLQKRVAFLENQLATSPRSDSRASASTSRPSSRAHNHSPSTLPPLNRSVFDVGLTPETRHKRQVSLSMLKARIDSELAASTPSRMSTPTLGRRKQSGLPTVHEPRSRGPQLDDHIFWCNSCKADLIIL